MSKISPCLWYGGDAEEAASFYVALLPDSRIDHVLKSPTDYPGGDAGKTLLVEFTLAGQTFQALNGGEPGAYNQYLSLSVDCEDQAEVDRIWAAILENGGKEVACSWINDRWGVPWQIVPKALPRLLRDPDPAVAQRVFKAMMDMVKIDVAGLEAAAKARSPT